MTWRELAAHRVITVGRTSGNRALIDNALAQRGAAAGLVLRGHLGPRLGIAGLVEAGWGWPEAPQPPTPAADHPLIRTVPLQQPEVSRTIGLVRRHGAPLSRRPRSSTRCCSTSGKREGSTD